jgi:predicted O-methyltransferase YrrM
MEVLRHFILWNLGLAQAQTQTTVGERECLAKHAAGRNRLVEIGVWHGVTTRRLKMAMNPGGLLYAVDPFPCGRLGFSMQQRIAHKEVASATGGSVRWLRLESEKAAPLVLGEGPVDFVFIDGDHSYEALERDWTLWSRGLSSGGVVALHDSISSPDRDLSVAGSAIYTQLVIARDTTFVRIDERDSLTIWTRSAR